MRCLGPHGDIPPEDKSRGLPCKRWRLRRSDTGVRSPRVFFGICVIYRQGFGRGLGYSYEDKECVRIVFLLHKETMEENYDLEKLVGRCLDMEEPVPEEVPEKNLKKQEYDTRDHDWIAEQETGSQILKETENMWRPVKRFLNRHRRQKWGDFDGLHIEEEEL